MRTRRVLAALAIGSAFLSSGCGPSNETASKPKDSNEQKTFSASGQVVVDPNALDMPSIDEALDACSETDSNTCPVPAGQDCSIDDAGYDDIAMGATVSITNSSGKIIGLGKLDAGKSAAEADAYGGYPPCAFTFTVGNLPVQKDGIYGVEVSHRGSVPFSQADAGAINLSLGGSS